MTRPPAGAGNRTKGGFRTKKDAERALGKVMRAVGEGTHVARDLQTLGEWIERWLETMVPKVRASTLRDSRNGFQRVSDRLSSVQLQALRPLDLEELHADLLREAKRYGGGLAPTTVRNVHIAVWRSLADAQRFGLVSRNVATLVKPTVPQRAELTTWTAADVRAFLDAVADDRLMPACRLLAATGMRRGEVRGLRGPRLLQRARRPAPARPVNPRLPPGRRPCGRAGDPAPRSASHRNDAAVTATPIGVAREVHGRGQCLAQRHQQVRRHPG